MEDIWPVVLFVLFLMPCVVPFLINCNEKIIEGKQRALAHRVFQKAGFSYMGLGGYAKDSLHMYIKIRYGTAYIINVYDYGKCKDYIRVYANNIGVEAAICAAITENAMIG